MFYYIQKFMNRWAKEKRKGFRWGTCPISAPYSKTFLLKVY